MAKRLGTTWKLDRHTAAKHAILRRYLNAWIPILSSAHGRIVYIDGFAGPGEYQGGEPGSPIIALRAALAHKDRIKGEMSFLFIEEKKERRDNLAQQVAGLHLPANFHIDIHEGRCNEVIMDLLDQLDDQGDVLAPTFACLDPFGFSHTPLALLQRLMRHPRCEVLVTFMYEEINRFLSQEQQPGNFDALFGTTEWRKALDLPGGIGRKNFLRDLYRRRLEQGAGIKYVRAFEMLNERNQTDYFLFFCTNRIEGLTKMKEAMWKVDQTGTYSFSDATDPYQIVLFTGGIDPADIRKRVLAAFAGKEVSIEQLEEFLVTQTPYRETHLRQPLLMPMEKAGELHVDRPARSRGGTYPKGTKVHFL